MAAVAIDTSYLALYSIPKAQKILERPGGDGRRFHIHRVSAYATIVPQEIFRQLYPVSYPKHVFDHDNDWIAMPEALDWQSDPDDDLGDAEVLHHLHQMAATVPVLSRVISSSDQGNAATTLTGSALSASINARTQGRLLSSFHRQSIRISSFELGYPISGSTGVGQLTDMIAFFPSGVQNARAFELFHLVNDHFLVWAGPPRDDQAVFWQVQVDVVDLFSRRTFPTSCPGKRRRTTFNPFLQISGSPFVEDTSRRNPLPHKRRFKGVRHRLDRRTWVAEMKPPKHKTKQDFGNFKTEAEAARAVDAAFHHYGKPHLLNFPDTSLQFLSTRPTAPPGLDEKAKVKFVKEEAKLLLAATAATSPLHSTHTSSLQILERSASPRRSPSCHLRSLSEISSPFSCSGPDEADAAVSHLLQWVDPDSICDNLTTGVQETVNSVQNAVQVWDWPEDSSTRTSPPNVVDFSADKIQPMWLDSLIRSPPAPMYSRSPSPSHFQEGIAHALLEQQSI